jgi:hypothetical protein
MLPGMRPAPIATDEGVFLVGGTSAEVFAWEVGA